MNNLPLDKPIKRKSIVILTSKNIPCLFTLKKIVEKDCIIKGVVICEKKGFFYRINKEILDIKKYGLFKRLSQIFLSIYFILFKSKSENIFLNNCFEHISLKNLLTILNEKKIEVNFTTDYNSNKTLEFIKFKNPDFLVSHTPYWIGRKVRELSKEKIVIGSHPGIVPYYRGAHSAFWSKLNGDKNRNGYSIFCLDKGIDSGPIIKQEIIPYNETCSYKCNDYLLMKKCSLAQADLVENYSKGNKLNFTEQLNLDDDQIKKAPGILDYLKFQKVMKK